MESEIGGRGSGRRQIRMRIRPQDVLEKAYENLQDRKASISCAGCFYDALTRNCDPPGLCSWRQMAFVSSLIDRCGWAADRSVGDFGQALPVGFGTKATHTTNGNTSVPSTRYEPRSFGLLNLVYAYILSYQRVSTSPTHIFRQHILRPMIRSSKQANNTGGQ